MPAFDAWVLILMMQGINSMFPRKPKEPKAPKCTHSAKRIEVLEINGMPVGLHYYITECLVIECGVLIFKTVDHRKGDNLLPDGT